MWTKAHVGTDGNEIADQLAKGGSLSSRDPDFPLSQPWSAWCRRLRGLIDETSRRNWETAFSDRKFFAAAPELSDLAFITGRGKFRSDRLIDSAGPEVNGLCDCPGKVLQTANHVLFTCPLPTSHLGYLRLKLSSLGSKEDKLKGLVTLLGVKDVCRQLIRPLATCTPPSRGSTSCGARISRGSSQLLFGLNA
jgi:hypothetical protein